MAGLFGMNIGGMAAIDTLIGHFEQARAIQEARFAAAAEAIGEAAVRALQAEAPYDDSAAGEHLRDAFEVHIDAGPPTVIRVVNTSPHRDFVVHGHGEIVPVAAKALVFEIDGVTIFAKRVGPVDPNDYPSRAAARLQPELQTIADGIAAHIAADIQG